MCRIKCRTSTFGWTPIWVKNILGRPVDYRINSIAGLCGIRHIILEDEAQFDLMSAEYPDSYPPNILCTWTVSSVSKSLITVDVFDLLLETGFDYLIFGKGSDATVSSTIVTKMTGTTKIRRLVFSGDDAIWIKFLTDRTGVERGFSLGIKSEEDLGI